MTAKVPFRLSLREWIGEPSLNFLFTTTMVHTQKVTHSSETEQKIVTGDSHAIQPKKETYGNKSSKSNHPRLVAVPSMGRIAPRHHSAVIFQRGKGTGSCLDLVDAGQLLLTGLPIFAVTDKAVAFCSPLKVTNFYWFNGRPISRQKLKVVTSKQHAQRLNLAWFVSCW